MILLWDVKAEEPLDERSRSLLKRLLDETPQRPQQPVQQSHADPPVLSVAPTAPPSDLNAKEAPKVSTPAPPPADMVSRVVPPRPDESGACHPLLFLAKPSASVSKRPTKPKPSTHIRRPRSRGHHTRQMGLLPPPGNPPRKAGDSMRTTAPDTVSSPADRTLARPPAAASWAIVPANPAGAPVRQKRSRLETVGPATETPKESRLGSESTRVGPPTHRVKTEPGRSASSARGGPSEPRGRIKKTESSDQTAKNTKKKEPPDRGSTVYIARSSSGRDCTASECPASKRDHRKQIRDPRDQTVRYPPPTRSKTPMVSSTHQSRPRQRERSPRWTSSETSGRAARPRAMPARRTTGSSSSACNSHGGKAPPRKPRREDSGGAVSRYKERSTRRGATPLRHDPPPSQLMMLSKRKPSVRPIVAPSRSKAGDSIAMAKVEPREKKAEKKEGRLRRLKNSLGLIFHHHHHHYHHHPPPPDATERGRRRRQHRPLGKLLGGIFHHKGGKVAADGGQRRPPPKQVQRHGYLHMMLEGLLRHLWRGARRRKQRPPRPGGAAGRGAVKKLHWWQRLRRQRRGLRVGSRRRPLLRLGFGRKATMGGGGSKKKK